MCNSIDEKIASLTNLQGDCYKLAESICNNAEDIDEVAERISQLQEDDRR